MTSTAAPDLFSNFAASLPKHVDLLYSCGRCHTKMPNDDLQLIGSQMICSTCSSGDAGVNNDSRNSSTTTTTTTTTTIPNSGSTTVNNDDSNGSFEQKIKCLYCRNEFRHNVKLFGYTVSCTACTSNLRALGKPNACEYCKISAAWAGTKCQRCCNFERLFGPPVKCTACQMRSAFDESTPIELQRGSDYEERRQRLQLMCWLCQESYKKSMAKAEEKFRKYQAKMAERASKKGSGGRGAGSNGHRSSVSSSSSNNRTNNSSSDSFAATNRAANTILRSSLPKESSTSHRSSSLRNHNAHYNLQPTEKERAELVSELISRFNFLKILISNLINRFLLSNSN